MHHAPTYTQWSARGTLAISVGTSYRFFAGVSPSEISPEHPWPVSASEPLVRAAVERGRPENRGPTATFGRGDDEGFPALTSPTPRGKASDFGTAAPAARSPMLANLTFPDGDGRPPSKETSRSRARSAGGLGVSRARKAIERVQGVVDDDFSMVARRRIVAGYGLGNVREQLLRIIARTDDPPARPQRYPILQCARRG
jgi:hypothetical protein